MGCALLICARLAHLPEIQLTVTVGRNAGLKVSVEKIRNTVMQQFETDDLSDGSAAGCREPTTLSLVKQAAQPCRKQWLLPAP